MSTSSYLSLGASSLLALALVACGGSDGPTCPPGYFFEPQFQQCFPCPQGTYGYKVAQSQPVYTPPVNNNNNGGIGQDAGSTAVDGTAAGDVQPSGGAPSLDTITGGLSTDTAGGDTGDATGTGGDASGAPLPDLDVAVGQPDTGTATPDAGTPGAPGGFQDPPESAKCGGCPDGFSCRTLPSGALCIAHTCLYAPPVVQVPVVNNGSGNGTTPSADAGSTPSDVKVGGDTKAADL